MHIYVYVVYITKAFCRCKQAMYWKTELLMCCAYLLKISSVSLQAITIQSIRNQNKTIFNDITLNI